MPLLAGTFDSRAHTLSAARSNLLAHLSSQVSIILQLSQQRPQHHRDISIRVEREALKPAVELTVNIDVEPHRPTARGVQPPSGAASMKITG